MRKLKQSIFAGLMVSVFLVSGAVADTVILKNGDRVSGKDCSVTSGKVSLHTDYAQKIELDLSAVEKIIFDQPARVVFSDDSEKEVTELSIVKLDFSKIDMVNPPPPQVWSLDISAGYSLNHGNSDTQDINFQFTAVRSVEDSYRLTGHGEYFWGTAKNKDTGEEDTVTDRGLAFLQADLFLIENGYLYGRSGISFDKMQDLDRRIDNGFGLGYEIFRIDNAFLDSEVGVSYIDSKYDDGTKDHGVFLRFAENGKLKVNKQVTFEEKVEYKPKGKDFNDYLINAEVGVRVSLGASLYFKVTVIDRYDNAPAPGTKRNDVSVIGSLGVVL